MSTFVPEYRDLRTSLLFCFLLSKSAAEAHRMLVEAYGEHALSETQCREWFRRFRSNNFDIRNEERGRPSKKFTDAELLAILDENSNLTQKQIAEKLNVDRATISRRLHALGKIKKPDK